MLFRRNGIVAKGAYYLHHIRPPVCVCPQASTLLSQDRFNRNLVTGTFTESCREIPDFATIGQKYRAVYMTTYVRCIVSGDTESRYKHYLRMKWYQAVWMAENV